MCQAADELKCCCDDQLFSVVLSWPATSFPGSVVMRSNVLAFFKSRWSVKVLCWPFSPILDQTFFSDKCVNGFSAVEIQQSSDSHKSFSHFVGLMTYEERSRGLSVSDALFVLFWNICGTVCGVWLEHAGGQLTWTFFQKFYEGAGRKISGKCPYFSSCLRACLYWFNLYQGWAII